MDAIEQRVDIMEKRLESVEDSQDRLTTMQGDVLEMLKGQREEILEIRRNSERLAIIQRDVTEMLKGHDAEILELKRGNNRLEDVQRDVVEMLRAQNEELKLHREELQESKRFNRQTRQLWIIIARKMDWLDEDLDIDSLYREAPPSPPAGSLL